MLSAAVITVSDSGFEGRREDVSGEVVRSVLADNGFEIREK